MRVLKSTGAWQEISASAVTFPHPGVIVAPGPNDFDGLNPHRPVFKVLELRWAPRIPPEWEDRTCMCPGYNI